MIVFDAELQSKVIPLDDTNSFGLTYINVTITSRKSEVHTSRSTKTLRFTHVFYVDV